MSFCANCGRQIYEAQSFCAACGTSLVGNGLDQQQTAAQPPPPSDGPGMQPGRNATLQKLRMLESQTLPPPNNSGKKILIAVLAVFIVGAIAAVAGVVYVGYRVKQKARAALNNFEGKSAVDKATGQAGSTDSRKSNSDKSRDGSSGSDADNPLAGVLGKLKGSDDSGESTPMGNMFKDVIADLGVKNPEIPPDLVRNIPYSALTSPLPCPATTDQIDAAKLASGRILFKPGTVLTDSWSLPLADAESDNIIQAVSPASLVFEWKGVAGTDNALTSKSYPDFNQTVCAKDIVQGEAYATGWTLKSGKEPIAPGLYPGVSFLLVPGTRFNDLKSMGSTKWVHLLYYYMDALNEWELVAWKGTLTRVEPDDVPFPLIINDERVNVPSIHVRAKMKVIENAGISGPGRPGPRDQAAEAYILDDPNAPVMLSWMLGADIKVYDSFKVQLIRVTYPRDKATIEQQLAKNRKAITWGINFDFNSDTIRPVSEPVLKEIEQAMFDRPDWKLTVTGHTDNIGGQKYNLELSQQRSASVKKALVERYRVDPNRLSTSGEGDSAPIDTNDTLEGRARNRRVELTLD